MVQGFKRQDEIKTRQCKCDMNREKNEHEKRTQAGVESIKSWRTMAKNITHSNAYDL
jgi:hypothetical protein